MNTSWKFIALGAAASMLGACATRVTREIVHEQPIVQPSVERVERVTIVQPPAAPQEQIPPAPSVTGYSWIPGHHVWRDGTWVWERGQWTAGSIRAMPPVIQETPPPPTQPGVSWVPGYWNFVGRDWVWVNGHWQ